MLRARQPPTRLVWLRRISVQTDPTAQTWHDLVRTSVFLFTLIVLFSEEFLLHSSGHLFYWGVSLTLLELVLLRSFSYTPRADLSEEFLLRASSWFEWGISLTLLELVLVRSFSYTPRAGFSEKFLLHSSSWFLLGVSLKLHSSSWYSEEFLLHSWC